MECDKADLLMMKYMDGTLGETERERLDTHMESCAKCREDFLIYEEIKNELPARVIFAPDNFESLVMERIKALPENKKFAGSIDSLLCVVWGVFSALFGAGFLAVMNKDAVLAYIADNPSLAGYADLLVRVSRYTEDFAASFTEFIAEASLSVGGYIASSRYVLLLIVAVLAALQYVVYKKNKAEV